MDGNGKRYHYVITLQTEALDGIRQVTYEEGTITPDPGMSRGDVFRWIFHGLASRCGSVHPVPLFFSLEADDL